MITVAQNHSPSHPITPSPSQSLAVSVIVPTYREAENLPLLVPAVHAALSDAGFSHEIIIVDDNSQDGSEAIVAELSRTMPVRIILRTNERGLSSAVMRGFQEACGEVLVCMDADLSHPPEKIPELVQAITKKHADFAIGSRYVTGGSTDAQWSVFRMLNSKVATWMARPLTRVRDPMSGYFALPRERFVKADSVNAIGYKIGLELLIKTRSQRCVEVPIHFQDRTHGQSKLSARQQIQYVRQLGRLLWHRWGRSGRMS